MTTRRRRLLVLNQEFAGEWSRFLSPNPGADQVLARTLGRELLPFWAQARKSVVLTDIDLMAESDVAGNFDVKLTVPGHAEESLALQPVAALGNHHGLHNAGYSANQALFGDWALKIRKAGAPDWRSLKPDDIRHAYLLLTFRAT